MANSRDVNMGRDKVKILWAGDQHSDEKSRNIDSDRWSVTKVKPRKNESVTIIAEVT